jgi:hypothetical protein
MKLVLEVCGGRTGIFRGFPPRLEVDAKLLGVKLQLAPVEGLTILGD